MGAGVAELADALDSKSSIREDVWVRPPPPAPSKAVAAVYDRPQTKPLQSLGVSRFWTVSVNFWTLDSPNLKRQTSLSSER